MPHHRIQKILLLDNRDSFVHNLARYFRQLGQTTEVVRSDIVSARWVAEQRPMAIVISPGPCTPNEAGCSLDIVRELSGTVPILGVCLGHQVIGQALGCRVIRGEPVHGMASLIDHSGSNLFAGLKNPLQVGRYHSLILDPNSLPSRLHVLARSDRGEIMAIADQETETWGVQFHPESILTEDGDRLLENFLRIAGLQTKRQISVNE